MPRRHASPDTGGQDRGRQQAVAGPGSRRIRLLPRRSGLRYRGIRVRHARQSTSSCPQSDRPSGAAGQPVIERTQPGTAADRIHRRKRVIGRGARLFVPPASARSHIGDRVLMAGGRDDADTTPVSERRRGTAPDMTAGSPSFQRTPSAVGGSGRALPRGNSDPRSPTPHADTRVIEESTELDRSIRVRNEDQIVLPGHNILLAHY